MRLAQLPENAESREVT